MRILLILALLAPSVTLGTENYPASFICGGVTDQSQHQDCVEKAKLFTEERNSERPIKETPFWMPWVWPVTWWLVYYGFALIIGGYVYRDAKKREWVFLGIKPVWWAVLVLFDPALGVLAYWAAHYSKLAQTYSEATARAPTS